MEQLKSSMTDTWKLFALGSLFGWLVLLLFLQQTNHNINLLAIRNLIDPSSLSISTIEPEHPNLSEKPTNKKKKCNIFDGKWVYKPDGNPSYDPLKCPFVEEKMSCKKNGRPDLAYERWIWEATDCEIPVINGTYMAEKLRNKRVILVGDSLNRNMWESLACILYSSIPSSRAIVYDESSVPVITLKAKDYNFTLEFYWSPFLVEFNLNHKETGKKVLVLDKLSPNFERWSGADIMIFNSGHWWAQTGKYKRYDFLEYEGKLIEDMEVELAYEQGMKTWRKWIEENVDPKKTSVFFRSISTEHKSSKQWCYNKTQPIKDESYVSYYPESLVQIIEKMVKEMSKSQVRYLNITKLSEYRIDAHPSMYRYKDWRNLTKVYADILPAHADCSHWCLPGVPDTWNRLLYVSLFFNP
ncbi:protein trichome birefringence-like 39 [Spinacia oleracea]|uniref:Protein trichome birefringence-like 39 n=1 Tax=Spinacia oleracea TaxID=3562 RepID=A0A9R0I4E3_SPIOL|nr:protein trichome birefringence-like 39 [Spinacia oleracea]